MSDLRVFFDPGSVAVVGASQNPAKWGYWVARGALRGASRRTVSLVNAGGGEILGVPAVRSLAELAEAPELVVLCTPAQHVPSVIEDALARGTRGFLGITAGVDSVHGAGTEERLARLVRDAGARLIGPNCLGLYDAAAQVELAWGTFTPGRLAIVSQSGQLGLELAGLAAHGGLGVSRFVSVGNQTDVTAVELADDLVDDPNTRAVVLYLENFGDGRALLATLARLREAGKPALVLTVGATESSREAARSHTGSLTSPIEVVRSACRDAGAILVDTPMQAIEVAHVLLGGPLPAGRRTAIVSDSGGQGAIAADTFSRHGLEVPRFSEATQAALTELLPAEAGVGNPVDLAGAGEQDLATYGRIVDLLAASGEVDAVVLSGYLGSYGADTPELEDRELEVVHALGETVISRKRPVIVHSMQHDSLAVRSLRADSVPTLHSIDAVARALGAVVDVPAQPRAMGDVKAADSGAPVTLPYLEGRQLLVDAGVHYPAAVAVHTDDDVRAAAESLAAPMVLKAGWLEHKSDVGGVALGLGTPDEVVAAFETMHAKLGDGDYVLESMDTQQDIVELIVGARRDDSFGPLVMVGAGGVQAELHQDVQVALAPLSVDDAERLLLGLRAAPLFAGWRGAPAVDLRGAAEVVSRLAHLFADDPTLVECDINPLRVGPHGAVAVDALVLKSAPTGHFSPLKHTERAIFAPKTTPR